MKQTLLSIALGALLLFPGITTRAQTTYTPEMEAILRPILLELIQELQSQINELIAQQQEPDPDFPAPTPKFKVNSGSGEADISGFTVTGIATHKESAEHARIATISFEIDDADVELKRIELALEPLTPDVEDDPWQVIEKIHIEEDRDIIGSESADDEDDWDAEDSLDDDGGEEYEIRVTTNHVLSEGNADLDILIDIQSDIEGDEQEWEVFIPDGGILFVSELGVFTNEGDHTQRASFKVLEN